MDIESISEFFKIEDDPFYRRGYAKAMNKKVKSIIGRMKKGGLSPAQISKYTKLSIEEIEKL